MKYPCLVPKRLCKTPVHVRIEQNGINQYGEPLESIELDLVCNYQQKAHTVFTDQKRFVEVTGTALFSGDICPNIPQIAKGTVLVYGEELEIVSGQKNYNPDGSVNYCTLEVK